MSFQFFFTLRTGWRISWKVRLLTRRQELFPYLTQICLAGQPAPEAGSVQRRVLADELCTYSTGLARSARLDQLCRHVTFRLQRDPIRRLARQETYRTRVQRHLVKTAHSNESCSRSDFFSHWIQFDLSQNVWTRNNFERKKHLNRLVVTIWSQSKIWTDREFRKFHIEQKHCRPKENERVYSPNAIWSLNISFVNDYETLRYTATIDLHIIIVLHLQT